jgi:hypothetical protein
VRQLKGGPRAFAERPFYSLDEIDRICAEELVGANLYPIEPSPIRIERFIEKRFGVTPDYDDLDPGILGFTRFGPKGVEAIIVSRSLAEEATVVAERRVNTTLAHEAGHGLLHGYLFALGHTASLFGNEADPTRILCRDGEVAGTTSRRDYDGRWWEYQANRAIGGLLLPQRLVAVCLTDLVTEQGVGGSVLPGDRRDEAGRRLAEVFAVNPVVARIRIDHLYPAGDELQLTL